MKRKLLLLFLLGCSWIISQAQTFNKRFGFDGVGTLCYAVELRDTFMFVAGIIADTTVNGGLKSVLAKFDYSGNEISKVTLRPTENPSYVATRENSMITTTDGGLAATGYATDTLGKILLSFTKYDSQGAIQYYETYKPNVPGYRTVFGYKILQYAGMGYYITGTMQFSNFQVSCFLAHLDDTGNLLFFKTYPYSNANDGVRGIVLLPDSSVILSVVSVVQIPNYWEQIAVNRFLEIDTGGTLLHAYVYNDSSTSVMYNIQKTYDGNFLSSGNYYALRQPNAGYKMQCCIVKWDTSFNPIWSYTNGIIPDLFNSFSDFDPPPVKI